MAKTHEDHGRELAQIRDEGQTWFARRDKAILAAHKAGMSLRTIASFVGLSQTGVQKIVNRENGK